MNNLEALRRALTVIKTPRFHEWMAKMTGNCPRWKKALEHISLTDVANYAHFFLVDEALRQKYATEPSSMTPTDLEAHSALLFAQEEIATLRARVEELEDKNTP